MEQNKSNIDAVYENKIFTQKVCEENQAPMTLSNQPLHVIKFSIEPSEDGGGPLDADSAHDQQYSNSVATPGILTSYTDSENDGTPSSPTSCASMEKELLNFDTKQAPVDYPRLDHNNMQGLELDLGDSQTKCTYSVESPIFRLPSDIMAEILVFLEPSEVLEVVSSPLCKKWLQSYAHDHDLWKVLCTLKPFKVDHGSCQAPTNEGLLYSFIQVEGDLSFKVSRHRLVYISFVRCVNYLRSLKQGNRNTTSMKPSDRGIGNALGVATREVPYGIINRRRLGNEIPPRSKMETKVERNPQGSKLYDSETMPPPSKRPRYGKSMITSRLLGPSSVGAPSHLTLPRSCAIFSVVNWMVAHAHVEGIQTLCLEALPQLLEDEEHRTTAQRADLSNVVFRTMMAYPGSVNLHSAAFHTLVLLGRPLGGQEGMIIDLMDRPVLHGLSAGTAAFLDLEASGGNRSERRIPMVLDSMRRFEQDERLQTRACWALVNLALVPSQKSVIIHNGGIEATLRAMQQHPKSHGVQFRALFALINLAVPCTNSNNSTPADPVQNRILDTCVEKIVKLAVSAVMNFPSSSSIRNKACLVLHNLSLSSDYMMTLLWTRHCYNLLSFSANNDADDQVLQRSSIGAVQRMHDFMSHREGLETEFSSWIATEPDVPCLVS
ncbi:unnamed protein product [Cylindrotheca closterium]|uniref:F-box domain-containing protein n=1 Tax=Cylindrotheca closterium TaxID=2856 RepID=A0AAD2FIS7_9STRA|nr:unnamed protein product [Cylindrotheca closterium]